MFDLYPGVATYSYLHRRASFLWSYCAYGNSPHIEIYLSALALVLIFADVLFIGCDEGADIGIDEGVEQETHKENDKEAEKEADKTY